ncbi:MAG: hypothetical protein HYU36_13010 [Planctomycetes bacterium]|nr:hypothetical protein [Planctomycetota bacterium]
MPNSRPEETTRASRVREWVKTRPQVAIYLLILLGYVALYQATQPDVDYRLNIVFQKWVAAGISVFFILAIIELIRRFRTSQVIKVVFWALALVYTLGDVAILLRRVNRFPYFPELLVGCYLTAIILAESEKKPARTGHPAGKKRVNKSVQK